MFGLFAPKKKEPRKVGADLADRLKAALKARLCSICEKNTCSKAAFGEGVPPALVCNNCELKAVGGSTQKLGERNLVTCDRLAGIVLAEAMGYQSAQTEQPAEVRSAVEGGLSVAKRVKESADLIREEYKTLREKARVKLEELAKEADQRNAVPVFEGVLAAQSERRVLTAEQQGQMVRRSLVGSGGVHFVDHGAVESSNASVAQKLATIKREHRAKLKSLNQLIDHINSLQL